MIFWWKCTNFFLITVEEKKGKSNKDFYFSLKFVDFEFHKFAQDGASKLNHSIPKYARVLSRIFLDLMKKKK